MGLMDIVRRDMAGMREECGSALAAKDAELAKLRSHLRAIVEAREIYRATCADPETTTDGVMEAENRILDAIDAAALACPADEGDQP